MKTYKKSTVALASMGLLLVTAIWGFSFVIVKEAVDVIPPLYMMAFRFTIASAGMAVLFAKRLRNITKQMLLHGAWIGIWLFLAYVAQTWGCKYTTAGKNAFITVMYVVIVPVLSWALFHARPKLYSLIAAALALLGVGMLSLNGEGGINMGDWLTLAASVFFAVHMVFVNHFGQEEDPVLLTLLQLATAALLSWILAPILEGAFPTAVWSTDMIGSMLYLGLLASMLGFLLQNVGQKYTPPATAALLMSMESVFGTLSSVIFLKERISPKMLAGCAIVLFAVILAETRLEFLPFMKKREGADA